MIDYYNNQIIIEARYNNSLFFNDFNILQGIIDKTKDIFINSSYNNNQKILFLNDISGKNSMQLSANTLVINANEPESFDKFYRIGHETVKIVLSNLKISALSRIGMRSIRGISKENLDKCSSIIKDSLFKFNDKALKYLNTINQCSADLNFMINNYNIALNIKPNIFQVIEIQNNKLERQITKNQILVNSDIFRNNVKADFTADTNFIDEFIKDVININKNNIDKFLYEMGVY